MRVVHLVQLPNPGRFFHFKNTIWAKPSVSKWMTGEGLIVWRTKHVGEWSMKFDQGDACLRVWRHHPNRSYTRVAIEIIYHIRQQHGPLIAHYERERCTTIRLRC